MRIILAILIMSFLVLQAMANTQSTEQSSDRWQGVDEKVIEKIAKQHGREPSEPVINTDQGDLMLFLFLLAGAVGGFMAGYYYKSLVEKPVLKNKGID